MAQKFCILVYCQDLSLSPVSDSYRYESIGIKTQDKLSNFDTSVIIPQYLPTVYNTPSNILGVAQKTQENKVISFAPTYEDLSNDEEFFLVSEGLPLWQVVSFISKHFKENIIVYDDIKDRPIFATIQGAKLKTCLNVLSWLTNSEYIQKDNIYYFGSNSSQILVLPSTDINQSVETIFTNVKAKQIEDKLVIVGNQKDVAKIKDSYNQILDRSYCIVHLYAFSVSYEDDLKLGVDIDRYVRYTFSWENMISNQFNPIQTMAVGLKASVVANDDLTNVQSFIDTDIGLLSGKELLFQDGLDWDRPIYSQSQYGEQSQVISGYSTQHTGIILKIKAYNDGSGQWFINFGIENSRAESDLKRRLTTLQTVSKLSKESPVQMLAKLEAGEQKEQITKGVPFLEDIPLLGYFFRITQEVTTKKNLYFILTLKPTDEIPKDSYDENGLFDLNRVRNGMQKAEQVINPLS